LTIVAQTAVRAHSNVSDGLSPGIVTVMAVIRKRARCPGFDSTGRAEFGAPSAERCRGEDETRSGELIAQKGDHCAEAQRN
jgi:hypothetical protein